MGSWYILSARPEDKALLESNLSAEAGDDGGAEHLGLCLSLFCPSRFPQSVKLRGFWGRAPEMFQRRLIPQAAVGPLPLIVAPPRFDLFLSILEA